MKRIYLIVLFFFINYSCSQTINEKIIMETVKKTDWTKIQTITVTLEEYKFVPDKMTFKIGQPYKLVLKNSGKEKHYYTSVDFFKSIALRKVQTKDGEVKANYLTAIEVYPDKEIEVFFVPIKAGNFELICTIEGHPEKGMIGKITIEDNDTRGKTYRSIY